MALFSSERVGTWSGYPMYGTLYGSVGRSGNTVTISGISCSYSCTNAWGTDTSFWGEIRNGGTQLDRTTGLTMSGGSGSQGFSNCSFTVGASDTSHQLNFRTSDGYTVYFTVYFDANTWSPATPTCTPTASSATLINVSWGVSDLGNPTGNVKLYNGTTNNPTNLLQTKTTTGTNTFGNDQRTANTTYYYKAVAANTIGTKTSSVVSATTYPAGVTNISTTTTATTATHEVTCGASGNALTTTLQKSHNNSNWTDVATDVQGTTVTVTETGLTPDHLYTIYFRVVTTAGDSGSTSKPYRTQKPALLYGSVNGQTKAVKKLYGSLNGQTKEIKKLYGSVGGVTKLIYQG